MARTQIPGRQIGDATVDTVDITNLAVTEDKLSRTGVAPGTFTKVSVSVTGRVLAGENPTSLTGAGLTVNLDDLNDVILTTPVVGHVLSFNGNQWVNNVVTGADLSLKLYSENPQVPIEALASGFNSVALGSGATAGASNSFAFGDQSLSRIEGSLMVSSGRFASQGDAQIGSYLLRTHTVNAYQTELFLNGTAGGNRLSIPDDSTWVFEATVVGHQQDGNGHGGFRIKGVIFKSGAINTSILGSVSKEVIAANLGWDVNVTADQTHGSLKITATGEAGKIIRWLAIVKTTEVSN